ncbi:Triosephosphate isomerase like protein [Verticillium longisporum]|uniref:Triosephosphate isomerase n=1 Tax=Verticillium longisporum TaxID=100787 RepID=A0A8I2ZE90_VERLO|nr:Triosephosphate isomerase like protein [Verticillium longisporum]
MARKFFVGGNFKMNGTTSSIKEIVKNLNEAKLDANTEVVIAPPALYLPLVRSELRQGLEVAAQNVFDKPNGAFTGEISNCKDLAKEADIDGFLVGGASLKPAFVEIINSKQ